MSGKNYLDISYDPVVFPDDSNYGKEIAKITFDRTWILSELCDPIAYLCVIS